MDVPAAWANQFIEKECHDLEVETGQDMNDIIRQMDQEEARLLTGRHATGTINCYSIPLIISGASPMLLSRHLPVGFPCQALPRSYRS